MKSQNSQLLFFILWCAYIIFWSFSHLSGATRQREAREHSPTMSFHSSPSSCSLFMPWFRSLASFFIHWPRRTQKMQNIPLPLSSLTSRTRSLPRSPITKLPQLSHLLSSSATHNFHAFSDVSCRKPSYPPSSLRITARNPASFLISGRKNGAFKTFAALVPDAKSDEPSKPSALIRTLQLGAMFGIWYLLNIYFNIYNKQVLHLHHCSVLFKLFLLNVWFSFLVWSLLELLYAMN